MDYLSLTGQEKADTINRYLKEDYPVVRSPLFHRNAFEFLIAVMLSPQTNDETTNLVTPVLFERYSSPEALAAADPEEVLNIIRRINYNKTKTARIIQAARMLLERFDGKVPASMDDMLKLPGVGRKVANVILNDWYATPASENPPYEGESEPDRYNALPRGSVTPSGFVVDTHVNRVTRALLLTDASAPEKIEQDMMRLLPKSDWMGTSLRMVFHGREVFQAKNPLFHEYPKWDVIYSQLGY
ncbi:MAG: Ultraviolet N-glycosylase/AP lyase [candidate division WS6 bacterium OLB20]|uniref:Ultraviolet N-glycosylase/AP lyase n=1 Tax=candidate division WS6 bacterium OLB20 TaxID=1617426 RepID=A0A136LWJ2_9BACT|nr:MAG: Ultraviolet N-glycosylase/AP lyase [candidate division WS6 bacterium OLB20]